MSTDRRVMFSTQVIATQSIEGSEDIIRHTEFLGETSDDTVNKALGGKGNAAINAAQGSTDGWVSFAHHNAGKWEDQDDVWEVLGEAWDGSLLLGTTGVPLSNIPTVDCKFVYIKNTGSVYKVLVSVTADSPAHYYIVIPPNGSICFRGGRSGFNLNDVYVKASHIQGTTIEYIIAG